MGVKYMKICPNCNTENFCIERKCKECGTDLRNVKSLKLCPECKIKDIDNIKYCSGCETNITEMYIQIKKIKITLL